jgi:hypothetical protein
MASLKFLTRHDFMNVQEMCAQTVTSTDFGTKVTGVSAIALLISVDSFNDKDVYRYAMNESLMRMSMSSRCTSVSLDEDIDSLLIVCFIVCAG